VRKGAVRENVVREVRAAAVRERLALSGVCIVVCVCVCVYIYIYIYVFLYVYIIYYIYER